MSLLYRNDTFEVCLPLPEIIILVFSTFTYIFHFHSTFENNETDNCRSSSVLDISTVSSAYNIIIILTKQFEFCSISSERLFSPVTFSVNEKSSRLFRYNTKETEIIFPPGEHHSDKENIRQNHYDKIFLIYNHIDNDP